MTSGHTAADAVTAEQVWEVEPVLRRVVAARVRDPAAVDDLVQDALEHLLAARGRLGQDMMVPYGVVTARNLAVSHGRQTSRRLALLPTLVDLDSPEQPDEAVLRDEERAALAVALAQLPEGERNPLLAHEVDGTPVAHLAEGEVSPATMRVRLARSRAKLRVEYVLALRSVELPTTECRPTLLVLAGGDKTRQRAVATGKHLLGCQTCAELSEPLIERRRSTAVLVPLVALRWVMETVKEHPVAASVTATATAAAVAGSAVALAGAPAPHHPAARATAARVAPPAKTPAGTAPPAKTPVGTAPPSAPTGTAPAAVAPASPAATVTAPSATVPPAPAPSTPALAPTALSVDGHPLYGGGASLAPLVGHVVVAAGEPVESVVAHNGFWVGEGTQRVWVQLVGPLRPLLITAGEHVSFSALMVAQDPTFAMSTGVVTSEGADQLTAQAAHISVPTTAITVTP